MEKHVFVRFQLILCRDDFKFTADELSIYVDNDLDVIPTTEPGPLISCVGQP